MINWHDVNGNVTRTKIVKQDFKNVNALYQSLKAGLNSKTTYDLEGTKFNANNATFSKGFEAYKEGSRGGLIRRSNGILNFDISSTGNVDIAFKNVPINEKELGIDALRGAGKVGGIVGDGASYLGILAAPFTGGGSLSVTGAGKTLSLTSKVADIAADVLEGKTSDAIGKGLFVGVSQVLGGAIGNRMPDQLRKEIGDAVGGVVVDGIQSGYEKNKPKGKVEESSSLNLKIETKK